MDDAAPGGSPAGEPANTGDALGGAPPPPPAPPAAPRALTRSTNDRIIGGVSGGLGEYFHLDALFFRIAFVALSFVGGLGLLLYLIGWFIIPEAGAARPTGFASWAREHGGRTRAVIGGGLVVLAVVIAAGSLHVADEGLLWGLALLAVGVFILVQERAQPAGNSQARAPAAAPYAAASFPRAEIAPAQAGWAPSHVPRERSVLGIVTVAVALLAVGLATLIASAAGISLALGTALGILLVTGGAGLVVGTWFGRSRMLIVLGLLLLPVAAAAALVNEPLSGGTGDVHASPQVLADVRGEYHLAAGQLTLDLSQVDFSPANPTVTATVALGQLTVIVPAGVTVDMQGHAGAGEIDLLGHVVDGLNIDAASVAAGGATETVHLNLRVGFGQVNVVRAPAVPAAPARTP